MSFDEITDEIFQEFILPHIGIKEIGNLSMVCSSLRQLCDNNDVWKIFYLDTIKGVVLDTSYHYGAVGARQVADQPWRWSDSEISKYKQHSPLSNTGTYQRNSTNYLSFLPDALCIPIDLRKNLLSWGEVRTDGIAGNEFISDPDRYWFNVHEYNQYILKEWKQYNAERGLSIVNLCQCANHYEFKTLGIPDKCRNFKSFKKITLKKIYTKEKDTIKKVNKNLESRKRNLEFSRNYADLLKYQYLEAKKNYEKMEQRYGVAISMLSEDEKDKCRRENLIDKIKQSL